MSKLTSREKSTGKETMYRTAQALVGCVGFKAGEYVSITWDFMDENGVSWYLIDRTENGPCETVAYPAHHLTNFSL